MFSHIYKGESVETRLQRVEARAALDFERIRRLEERVVMLSFGLGASVISRPSPLLLGVAVFFIYRHPVARSAAESLVAGLKRQPSDAAEPSHGPKSPAPGER